MAGYRIEFTQDGLLDFASFAVSERRRIVDEVKRQLAYEPMVETRNRKRLRENPLARWELRIGEYRVFYEVEEDTSLVVIGAVGVKDHNVLYIRGQEVQI